MALIDRSVPLSDRGWSFWIVLGVATGAAFALLTWLASDESWWAAALGGVVFVLIWTPLFRFAMIRLERRRSEQRSP
jgi:predicted lysophospholipase L1 biosynthesis ABC-type transport system permease subunit